MSETQRARPIGMNHVAITVGDIDEALEFYQSIFSITLRGRSDTKAFVDMGDQFLAIAQTADAGEYQDTTRHIGLVVDDAAIVRERLDAIDVNPLDTSGLDFHDPWGNRFQIVEYASVQFTKADHVLKGMDATDLEKSEEAIAELAGKGMAPNNE